MGILPAFALKNKKDDFLKSIYTLYRHILFYTVQPHWTMYIPVPEMLSCMQKKKKRSWFLQSKWHHLKGVSGNDFIQCSDSTHADHRAPTPCLLSVSVLLHWTGKYASCINWNGLECYSYTYHGKTIPTNGLNKTIQMKVIFFRFDYFEKYFELFQLY